MSSFDLDDVERVAPDHILDPASRWQGVDQTSAIERLQQFNLPGLGEEATQLEGKLKTVETLDELLRLTSDIHMTHRRVQLLAAAVALMTPNDVPDPFSTFADLIAASAEETRRATGLYGGGADWRTIRSLSILYARILQDLLKQAEQIVVENRQSTGR